MINHFFLQSFLIKSQIIIYLSILKSSIFLNEEEYFGHQPRLINGN
jgi:hypothetical protein